MDLPLEFLYISFFGLRWRGLVVFLLSGLLFTVLELPVLWAALGVGHSLLSSLLAVSELPDPELTPLKRN